MDPVMQWCVPVALALALMLCLSAPARAETPSRQDTAAKNMAKWHMKDTLSARDPELAAIRDNLIFGEIVNGGSLSDKQIALVTLTGLTVSQSWDAFTQWLNGALANGSVKPVEVREALYQIAPYVGFPRVEAALGILNGCLEARGVALPLPPQGTVTEDNRFAKGLETQSGIFGNRIKNMHDTTPANQREVVVNYLSAYCFGDFYTRRGIDLKLRELVVFSAIISLGGCDVQAQGHAAGNIAVGNTKQNLIDAVAVLLPINGFPRTLNALAAVNAAVPETAPRQ